MCAALIAAIAAKSVVAYTARGRFSPDSSSTAAVKALAWVSAYVTVQLGSGSMPAAAIFST